ncbi:RICIN domain-containing protein [Micromonospora sp. NPDC005220]|uniref:RICIN domain-containing protein n=1 Tax=Micromonospora sp. NPDC005220 TaxID=3155589 RepID=UPI0033A203B5
MTVLPKFGWKRRGTVVTACSALLALVVGGVVAVPQNASAVGARDAEAMYTAFNSAFLVRSGSDVFYKRALNDGQPDGTWSASLDILGAEDAYERTGDPAKKALVNDLLNTWLKNTPPPWSWDGWNDDIGWFTLALIRGYQMTGNPTFLTQAKYGFDYAFGRGWDTKYNGGGIWEENPEYTARYNPPKVPNKDPLANDSLGKVACMIYQSTHDVGYLNKCQQIYDWVWSHLYNPSTGAVYARIEMDGTLNKDTAAYNQGTFADYANLLWEITGNVNIYNDAKRAIDYARNNLMVNGVFSNGAGYLNTWADEVARGAGHFVRDNRQWDEYYSWMVRNADAIQANRRTDLGITGNAWDRPTPTDNTMTANKFVSAMAWMQFTPASRPNNIGGIHVITNQKTGLAIDSAGTFGNGKSVLQWGSNSGQNQKWLFTQNSDTSWNIVNLSTWQAMDSPGGSAADNLAMVQWQPSRDSNQRWWVDQQPDGTYKIWNQASGKALDGASSVTNGAPLIQYGWNGEPQQRWVLQ